MVVLQGPTERKASNLTKSLRQAKGCKKCKAEPADKKHSVADDVGTTAKVYVANLKSPTATVPAEEADETDSQTEASSSVPIVETDVLVIGAGPHGLAVTARLVREQLYGMRLDDRSDQQRFRKSPQSAKECDLQVRVLDGHGSWMTEWGRCFAHMSIPYLRSPVTAHPDPSDVSALLRFAASTGRSDELQYRDDAPELNSFFKGRGRSQLSEIEYALPSATLFTDFCSDLASTLHDHTGCVITGWAQQIRRRPDDGRYVITTATCEIVTQFLVLSCGNVGKPRIPTWALSPHPQQDQQQPMKKPSQSSRDPCLPVVIHSHELALNDEDALASVSTGNDKGVVVVGSGMTGCWLALALARKYKHRKEKKIMLLSRHGLRVQSYDTGGNWAGPKATRSKFSFYSASMDARMDILREARGHGHGTVTPQLAMAVRHAASDSTVNLELVEASIVDLCPGGVKLSSGSVLNVGTVLLATGRETDVMSSPLFRNIAELVGGLDVRDGMPVLGPDLRLHDDHGIFVVGAMAAMSAGPDAHNLAGARTCSRLVTDAILSARNNAEEDAQSEAADDQIEQLDDYASNPFPYAMLQMDDTT